MVKFGQFFVMLCYTSDICFIEYNSQLHVGILLIAGTEIAILIHHLWNADSSCSLVTHTFHLAFLYRITLIIVTGYVIRMYLDLLDLLLVLITFTHRLYLV